MSAKRRTLPSLQVLATSGLLLCAAVLLASPGKGVGATYSDSESVDADFGADVLAPPSSLGANAVGLSQVTLTWTATPDSYATGYRIMRSLNGGAYSELTTVTPASTETYVDAVGSIGAGQYSYYLVTYYENWNSVASNSVTCTQVALVLVCI